MCCLVPLLPRLCFSVPRSTPPPLFHSCSVCDSCGSPIQPHFCPPLPTCILVSALVSTADAVGRRGARDQCRLRPQQGTWREGDAPPPSRTRAYGAVRERGEPRRRYPPPPVQMRRGAGDAVSRSTQAASPLRCGGAERSPLPPRARPSAGAPSPPPCRHHRRPAARQGPVGRGRWALGVPPAVATLPHPDGGARFFLPAAAPLQKGGAGEPTRPSPTGTTRVWAFPGRLRVWALPCIRFPPLSGVPPRPAPSRPAFPALANPPRIALTTLPAPPPRAIFLKLVRRQRRGAHGRGPPGGGRH